MNYTKQSGAFLLPRSHFHDLGHEWLRWCDSGLFAKTIAAVSGVISGILQYSGLFPRDREKATSVLTMFKTIVSIAGFAVIVPLPQGNRCAICRFRRAIV